MLENFIINSLVIYFIGMVIVSLWSLTRGFKKAAWLFVVLNILAFAAAVAYLWYFPSQEIRIAQFNWLFHFTPRLNLLSGIFFSAISGVSALVGIYSIRYLELYEKTYNRGATQSLMAAFVLGMQGVLLANNVFVFLFFWEVMSITSFFLVLVDKTQESLKAAFLYFIMTHLGASAILAGFLILGNGSLFFELQNIYSASLELSPAMSAVAFSLFLFGFGSKSGLVPFHVWLPEAHPQAPSNISAMMSGLMLKVAVFGFISVVFNFAKLPDWAGALVIALGILSGVVGVLYALIEKDLKRIFAYSSIENMGMIFTMIGLAIYLLPQSFNTGIMTIITAIIAFALFHSLSHVLFKTALFLSSGVIISRVHGRSLELMGGLAKIMPIFSAGFLLAILGALPIAPFGTFYGEWGFIQSIVSLFEKSFLSIDVLMMLVIILTFVSLISGLAIFAMVRVFAISMLGLNRSKHLETTPEKNDRLLTYPILTLAIGLVVLGAFAKVILDWLIVNLNLTSKIGTTASADISLSSAAIFALFLVALILAFGIRYLFIRKNIVRKYHTWDCGQPINETMEYSATAFSAPIRFFFLRFLGSSKMVSATPVVDTNPWIKKYTFSLAINSFWKDKLYQPAAQTLIFWASRLKAIQSGRIQYYLIFFLVTLIITLIIAI